MDKINFPYGTIYTSTEFEFTALKVIQSAIMSGWSGAEMEKMFEIADSDDFTELFAKRDEAIIWLNENVCEDNVEYQYFEIDEDTMIDGEEQNVLVSGYGIYTKE